MTEASLERLLELVENYSRSGHMHRTVLFQSMPLRAIYGNIKTHTVLTKNEKDFDTVL